MPPAYYDSDVSPLSLEGETIGVLGYGIQGRAQALNLRDSGVEVVVGNRKDDYGRQAREDGFRVLSLAEATERASLILFLIPDEIQPAIFHHLRPGLSSGKGLVFAHGFTLRYGLLDLPPDLDILLLAPRMPGQYVRNRYLDGWGVPAYISVEQDATGRGRQRLLGLASALGMTRCGVLEVSAAVETELDLFSEHFVFPAIFRLIEMSFQLLTEAGYPPEAALMELHGSSELSQVLEAAATEGLLEMIDSHASPACKVGIASHWDKILAPESQFKEKFNQIIEHIQSGAFARELVRERQESYPVLGRWRQKRSQDLIRTERALRKMLRRRPES